MRTQAKVIATDGKYATVQCDRTSACEGCHKMAEGGECSVCSLLGGARSMQTRAHNAVGARVGDLVEIETATPRVLGYAALVFLLPLAVAFFGYWLAGLWMPGEPLRYLCAAELMALTFVGIRLYSERWQKKKVDVTVVAVIEPHLPLRNE